MTVPATHCEARKVAYRQTKDGLVVSFVIHPNDMPDALATAPLGQRYVLAMAAIGDDEQPIEPASPEPAEERPGSSRPLPSDETGASRRAKDHYRDLPPERQALIRAGRLPRSDQFREWLASLWGVSMISEERAEEYIRNRCCNGGSRRQIAEDLACREAFLTLETDYYAATGQMAEVR